ncbi:MAG: hypothetical protein ACI81R_003479 [Bradymonadia bacterium]|jgi:hypothetical protein
MAVSIQHDGIPQTRSARWVVGPSLRHGAAATAAAVLVAVLATQVGLRISTLPSADTSVLAIAWRGARTLPLWAITAYGATALWMGLACAYDALRSWTTPRTAQDVVWWIALSGIGALAIVDPMVATSVMSVGICLRYAIRDRWWPASLAALVATLSTGLGALTLLLLGALVVRRPKAVGAWVATGLTLVTILAGCWIVGATGPASVATRLMGVELGSQWAVPNSAGPVAQGLLFGTAIALAALARRAPKSLRFAGVCAGGVGLLAVGAGDATAVLTLAAAPLLLTALLVGDVTERHPGLARPVWLAAVLSSAWLYLAGSPLV